MYVGLARSAMFSAVCSGTGWREGATMALGNARWGWQARTACKSALIVGYKKAGGRKFCIFALFCRGCLVEVSSE